MKTPVKTTTQILRGLQNVRPSSGVERHILESIVDHPGNIAPHYSTDVDAAFLSKVLSGTKYASNTAKLTDVVIDLERAGLIVQDFTDLEIVINGRTVRITPIGLFALRRAAASWIFLYDYTFDEGNNEIPGGVASFSRPTRYSTDDPRYLFDSYIEVDYAGRIARVNPITDETYPFERLDVWNARAFNRLPL